MRELKPLCPPCKTWTTSWCFVEGAYQHKLVCVCVCGTQGCAFERRGRKYVKKRVCACVRGKSECVCMFWYMKETQR